MSWILLLEENPESVAQIKDVLQQIDPKISIVHFRKSKNFLDWMAVANDSPTVADPPLPKDRFLGLITAIELWNFRDIQLIGKFKALFVQRGWAQREEDICVVFTGYESETDVRRRYEHRAVNNLIFKPFDKLLLRQMLEIAFTGRQKVKKYHVHNLKTEAKIEMLKEIRISGLTEIGFQTVSDQKIETGKTAKYYADFLVTDQHRSALAQAIHSDPIPDSAMSRVSLRFFALDQQQSFSLQRQIQQHKQTRALPGKSGPRERYEFIFLRDESGGLCEEIEPSIERFFDHHIRVANDIVELEAALKDSAAEKHVQKRFLFVDSARVRGNERSDLEGLMMANESLGLSIFLLSKRVFAEPLELALSAIIDDIFYAPFNRSYVIKTLKQRFPDLRTKEDLFESYRETDQVIHVSNPVKLVEVSEAGLVIEYYRELPVGSFREFVFWMPNEVDVPVLLAQCNFTERSQGGGGYRCHFIFFGMHDAQLKHLRLWMRHNYVEAKQKSGG